MTAADRALSIARARRLQSGGTTEPDQQPTNQTGAQNNYLGAMTAPMGANTSAYAAQAGYNNAAQLQNANWSGGQGQGQQGAQGQQPTQAPVPGPPPVQSGAIPPTAPANQPQRQPGTPQQAQPAAPPPKPDLSPQMLHALQMNFTPQPKEAPTKGASPVINAAGKNTVTTPGVVDDQGNEHESPSGRRVQDALANTAKVAGVSDALKQKQVMDVRKQDAVGDFVRGLMRSVNNPSTQQQTPQLDPLRRLLGGQQQPSPQPPPTVNRPTAGQAAPQQWNLNNLTRPSLTGPPVPNTANKPMQGGIDTQVAPQFDVKNATKVGRQPFNTTQQNALPSPSTQPVYNNAAQDAKEKAALAAETANKTPAPPPYRAPTMKEMASVHNQDVSAIPDSDQTPYKWWTSKHYFGILGGTMTGAEAVTKGVQFGKVTKEDQAAIYAAAQKDYQEQQKRTNPAVAQAAQPAATTTTAATSDQKWPGNSTQHNVANHWARLGMSPNGVAGIMRNIKDESAFDPTLRHPDQPKYGGEAHYAHGLYQDGGPEWAGLEKFAQQQGKDWRDPEVQTGFVAQRLKETGLWDQINNAKTPNEAANLFLRGYLRPAAQHIASRSAQYAMDTPSVEDQLAGNTTKAAVMPSGSAPNAGPSGRVSTAGSAGRGTPEQEQRAKQLAFQSWWREFVGGDPMLPYARENAKMGLYEKWSDWDGRRQFQYGNASPQEGAAAAVGANGSELSAHKTLDGAVKGAQSQTGEVHPGGHTTIGNGQAAIEGNGRGTMARTAEEGARNAEQAYNQLTPEQLNVAQAWRVQAQHLQDAARFRATGRPDYAQIANGMETAAVANQSKIIQEAAQTGKVNTERLRAGYLETPLGYFDLNHVNPQTGRPNFISKAELAQDVYDQLRSREEPQTRTQTPAMPSGPSIGGTGTPAAPTGAGMIPGAVAPVAPMAAPSPQRTSTTNKPLPASPALEEETKRRQANPDAPFAGPDYLNSREPAIPPPRPSEIFKPGGPYSTFGTYGQDTSNKEGDNKIAENTINRANAASRASLQIEQILSEAAKLKPGESGPMAHERQEFIGNWNQSLSTLESMTGIPMAKFKLEANASVDVIKLQSLEMAREIATGQGSTGRGAGVIMRMLIPHLPTAELPEDPDAIPRTAAALKAEAARAQDYAREQNTWVRQGIPLGAFDDWFEQAHPATGYVHGAEIYAARNENRGVITNRMVEAARQYPEAAKALQRNFKLSDGAMQRLLER